MRSPALILVACAAVSACGGAPDARTPETARAAPITPRNGGTLRVLARQPEALLRVTTRQLVARDTGFGGGVVADIARELPSEANGGITADGLTYTFHLRAALIERGASDGSLTAPGLARGLSSGPRSSAASRYLSETVAGVSAPDDSTLVFTLRQAANDFLSILALPGVLTAPIGPYHIVERSPGALTLARNPAWNRASDPIRSAHPDSIVVSLSGDASAARASVASGSADVTLGLPVSAAELPARIAANDSTLFISPGYTSLVRLVMNVATPTNRGVLRRRDVRRALAFAADRAAIVQLRGGVSVARAAQQLVAPGWAGARDGYAPFATIADRAHAEHTRELLLAAGVRDTLRLRLLVPAGESWAALASMLRTQFLAAGVRVDVDQRPDADALLASAAAARAGRWDMALGTVSPDWYGENNGRTTLYPSFHSRRDGAASANYGLYGNPAIDEALEHALVFRSPAEARDAWETAATAVLEDAAWIPLVYERAVVSRSTRTRNCVFDAASLGCDLAAVWIAPGR